MTGVDVMIVEVVTTEETVAVIFRTTIGNVQSVIIPTSHSELNVTAVESQKEEVAQISVMTAEVVMTGVDVTTAGAVMTAEVVMTEVVVMTEEEILIQESGKVMTADQVIEGKNLSQELAIGNVPNVENQISLRETSVSVVGARKE